MKLGWKRRLLSWVYPERCACCGEVIEAGTDLCARCREELPHQPLPLCRYCGSAKENCRCGKRRRPTDGVVSPFTYDGPARRAVQRLKKGVSPLETDTLAAFLVKTVRREYADVQFDAVTCVPKPNRELRKSDENASATLAQAVARQLGLPFEPLLDKVRETRPQKELSALERSGNLRGALDLRRDAAVTDRTLLLVDDVRTTGATLHECALILKIYGAKEVYAVTLTASGKEDPDGRHQNGN